MATVTSHSYLHSRDYDRRRKVVGILNLVFRRNVVTRMRASATILGDALLWGDFLSISSLWIV